MSIRKLSSLRLTSLLPSLLPPLLSPSPAAQKSHLHGGAGEEMDRDLIMRLTGIGINLSPCS